MKNQQVTVKPWGIQLPACLSGNNANVTNQSYQKRKKR